MNELGTALREALETLQETTGLDAEVLFGERALVLEDLPPAAAHAAGMIEGAAIASGMTVLELLDEILFDR